MRHHGRLLHQHEPTRLQVLYKPLGCDLGHQVVRVVDPLPAVKAEGKGQSLGDLVRGRGGVWRCGSLGSLCILAHPLGFSRLRIFPCGMGRYLGERTAKLHIVDKQIPSRALTQMDGIDDQIRFHAPSFYHVVHSAAS
jgi:hypothetical protein